MRAVEHDGTTYLLVTESSDSSRVRDPETGDEQYLPTDELTTVETGALETAARAVSEPVRTLANATHDDRGIGLLAELHERPRGVRELMNTYGLCESDALGLITELRAAGLVEEETVAGERGYALTEEGERVMTALVS